MNTSQIEYFLALCKYGSFKRTAEQLYVSQPAVSKQISLLEEELGFSLFERGYRTVTLTEAGKVYLQGIQECGSLYEKTVYNARKASQGHQYSIRFGAMEHTLLGNLFDIIANFQRSEPSVLIEAYHAPTVDLVLQDQDSAYDMVVNHERNLRNPEELNTRPLAHCSHMGLVAREHPNYETLKRDFSAFRNERFYVPSTGESSLTQDYCAYICALNGFLPREIQILPNVDAVLLAVKMGMGVAVLDDLIDIPEQLGISSVPAASGFQVLLAWRKDNPNPYLPRLADRITAEFSLEGRR